MLKHDTISQPYIALQAALLLRKQLAELNKNPVEGFSAGLIDDEDIFRWEVSASAGNNHMTLLVCLRL